MDDVCCSSIDSYSQPSRRIRMTWRRPCWSPLRLSSSSRESSSSPRKASLRAPTSHELLMSFSRRPASLSTSLVYASALCRALDRCVSTPVGGWPECLSATGLALAPRAAPAPFFLLPHMAGGGGCRGHAFTRARAGPRRRRGWRYANPLHQHTLLYLCQQRAATALLVYSTRESEVCGSAGGRPCPPVYTRYSRRHLRACGSHPWWWRWASAGSALARWRALK